MTNTFSPLGYAAPTGETPDGRSRYIVDTAQAMPAMLTWMSDHRDAIIAAGRTPDGALVSQALDGDWLARFTLGAKQLVWLVGAVLRDYPGCLSMVEMPAERLTESEAAQRAFTLYMARLLFTEALQQAITPAGQTEKTPLNDAWTRAEEWRFGAPVVWPPPINPE